VQHAVRYYRVGCYQPAINYHDGGSDMPLAARKLNGLSVAWDRTLRAGVTMGKLRITI